MEEKIFRDNKRNMIQSPDQLDEYIKVANPGMWMILIAIMLFITGGIIWCIFGKLQTKAITAVNVSDNQARCYLPEDKNQYVNSNLVLEFNGNSYSVSDHSSGLVRFNDGSEGSTGILELMSGDKDQWYYIYEIPSCDVEDGLYSGTLIIDEVSPLSFLTERK